MWEWSFGVRKEHLSIEFIGVAVLHATLEDGECTGPLPRIEMPVGRVRD